MEGGENQGADDTKNQPSVEAEEARPPAASKGKDDALAGIELKKNHSFVKAWEENENTKTKNKVQKRIATITSWENKKKASLEAKLKRTEEALEKKKANYAEKTKNKIASIHKAAEMKKAQVEADYKTKTFQTKETAAVHLAANTVPKNPFFACFG